MSLTNRTDLQLGIVLGEVFIAAAGAALRQVRKAARRNRKSPTAPRRIPGQDTPLWNLVVDDMRIELQAYGAKSRLARFLDVPPQRISDWVAGKSRVPDAETLLRILFWLNERRAGRDPSL